MTIDNRLILGKTYKMTWADGSGSINEQIFKLVKTIGHGQFEVERNGELSVITDFNEICHPWSFSSLEIID